MGYLMANFFVGKKIYSEIICPLRDKYCLIVLCKVGRNFDGFDISICQSNWEILSNLCGLLRNTYDVIRI